MPGELGDEYTQTGVGYYERLYTPTGEWVLSGYGTPGRWPKKMRGQRQLYRVLENLKRNKDLKIYSERGDDRPQERSSAEEEPQWAREKT